RLCRCAIRDDPAGSVRRASARPFSSKPRHADGRIQGSFSWLHILAGRMTVVKRSLRTNLSVATKVSLEKPRHRRFNFAHEIRGVPGVEFRPARAATAGGHL